MKMAKTVATEKMNTLQRPKSVAGAGGRGKAGGVAPAKGNAAEKRQGIGCVGVTGNLMKMMPPLLHFTLGAN